MSVATNMLKKFNLRATKQRVEILSVLIDANSRLCAEDVYEQLQNRGSAFDISTVYRTLATLEQQGIVEKSDIYGSTSKYYNITCEGHKHFLICTSCKKSIEIDGCPVEEYAKIIGQGNDYTITGHSFEMFGVCPKCKHK